MLRESDFWSEECGKYICLTTAKSVDSLLRQLRDLQAAGAVPQLLHAATSMTLSCCLPFYALLHFVC